MSTKLTLTIQDEVIERAKLYAKKSGRSLSKIVENYFRQLTQEESTEKKFEISEKVLRLKGILKTSNMDIDYDKILEEEIFKKHG